MPHDLVYTPLDDPAHLEAFRDVVFPTLNIPVKYWDTFTDRLGRENLRALRKAGTIIGGLGIYRMGQWFGGESLACGGVSVVGIAAEHRARGAAAHLMAAALKELHEDGTPLAALYASTQRLYRKVGFEQAGTRCLYEMPLSAIDLHDRSLSMRQVPSSDPGPFEEPARRRGRLSNGNIDRPPGMWKKLLSVRDETVYSYLAEENGRAEGYVIFCQEREGRHEKIHVRDMAALTPAAGRRLWTFLADHRSIFDFVTWPGPANDPLLNFSTECRRLTCHPERWMLRIVDARGALSRRGYPAAVEGELHLELRDAILPANNGRFVLTVGDGRGEVRSGGQGDLRTDIRGLAPLFSGFFPPRTLKMTGQLDADDPTLDLAARIFAGPQPWLPDGF